MNGVKILTPNSLRKLIKEAYLRGENNGHKTGYLSGYEAGYSDGRNGINRHTSGRVIEEINDMGGNEGV